MDKQLKANCVVERGTHTASHRNESKEGTTQYAEGPSFRSLALAVKCISESQEISLPETMESYCPSEQPVRLGISGNFTRCVTAMQETRNTHTTKT